jgi:hypothetical protein
MKLTQFPEDAYILSYANHVLYDGTPSSSPITLTGAAPTTVFRCKVTISVATGHSDCTGSIAIGSETLTFVSASTKQTTVNLSALPVVTYANLDCHIKIETIDSGGAPIIDETATATKIQYESTTSGFWNAQGQWTVFSGSYAMCKDAATVADKLRYNGSDMPIVKVDTEKWFSRILYYIFYL